VGGGEELEEVDEKVTAYTKELKYEK